MLGLGREFWGEGAASAEQIPVVVAHDRSGTMFEEAGATFEEAYGEQIPPSTDFCCDGGRPLQLSPCGLKLKIHVLPPPGSPKSEERMRRFIASPPKIYRNT
jgi:hypothetical protein